MDENLEIAKFLDMQTPSVRKNVEIVSGSEKPELLHIDLSGQAPKTFYPMFSHRAALSENNTVARITVADTLLGCLIGYSKAYFDYFQNSKKFEGYDINVFEYESCLKPNKKLVYDAEVTNEHWLVSYNKETINFKPKKIGTFFLIETVVSRELRNGKLTTSYVRTKTALECKETLYITKGKKISPGFYTILYLADLEEHMTYSYDDKVLIEKITEAEFSKIKLKHAPNISLESKVISLVTKW